MKKGAAWAYIGSIAGIDGNPGQEKYAKAKADLTKFICDKAKDGRRAVLVALPLVDTGFASLIVRLAKRYKKELEFRDKGYLLSADQAVNVMLYHLLNIDDNPVKVFPHKSVVPIIRKALGT